MTWLLFVPLILWLALAATLFFAQTSLLFPVGQVGPAPPPPAGAQPVAIDTSDGVQLVGLHIPPARPERERLLVLGFGGNAWNAEAMAALLHDFYPAADIVAFHYRGYRPSGGRPGAAALLLDAATVHDFAVARLRPSRTVAAGFSVGSGIAAGLAAQRRLDGLVLVTPFDSLARVGADHYPWLPVRSLLRHRLEPAVVLQGSRVPVAIVAAEQDEIIPAARTNALRARLSTVVFDRTIPDAGHDELYDRPDFRHAMRDALAQLTAQRAQE